MVRSPGQGSAGSRCIQGEQTIQFLNKLQKVAYRLNPFVVEVAEALQEQPAEMRAVCRRT